MPPHLRRLVPPLAAALCALIVALGPASPAAAATFDQKVAVLTSWTQANATSYNAWNSARLNESAWADYTFDWSTDYCSASPDQPLGFDFRLPCWHHDFGYRNYKHVNLFPQNKDHVDTMFYYDLKTKCATYNVFVRPACYSLAWTYYQAVHNFGSLVVDKAALDHAAALKAQGEARAAQAPGAV
jgi:Prokaryotic phospholipase A2